ncbi:hypothetical protein LIER_04891 [Lithospermum erythrorhizon]|uniref:Uncharacterized protein n=1 Tax=Lithospermum erythrorhizon TaxID=34254 RepID=A0AAV3P354_LITER
MNSMFSSFDALCAELMGQKITPSYESCTRKVEKGAILEKKQLEEKEWVIKKNQIKQFQEATRYAVEFDGLNCFETLVSSSR